MPRTKVVFASEALYTSVWATGKHFSLAQQFSGNLNGGISGDNWVYQLNRVQNLDHNWRVNHVDVTQFGQYAPIDRVILDSPTVNLNFSYILSNFANERALGFAVDVPNVNCLSGILNKTRDEKNYFIKVAADGVDVIGDTTNTARTFVWGFGNGYISSYSSHGAVGAFPIVDVSIEALNETIASGNQGNIPAIAVSSGTLISGWVYQLPLASGSAGVGNNFDISTLRPGDITISLVKSDVGLGTSAYDTFGADINDAKIQSYNIGFSLNREPIQQLGSRYAISREIRFPIPVDFTIEALLGDLTSGSLSDFINCDYSYDATINLYKPGACTPTQTRTLICQYVLKGTKLLSQDYSAALGANRTVRLSFQAEIGGPNQTGVGMFMSGIYPSYIFQNG